MAQCIGKETQEDELFARVTNEMYVLHHKKNADYGNAFHEAYKKIGRGYALGLLYNKVNRIITLMNPEHKQQISNESVRDTLIDLANYAIMTLIEHERERKENPNGCTK